MMLVFLQKGLMKFNKWMKLKKSNTVAGNIYKSECIWTKSDSFDVICSHFIHASIMRASLGSELNNPDNSAHILIPEEE